MTEPSNPDRKVTSLRELPQSIEPRHDLWPGIEARLGAIPAAADGATPAQRRAVRMRWLAAAAMVACVAIGVWVGRGLLPGTAGSGVLAVNTNPPQAVQPPVNAVPREVYDPSNALLQELLVNTYQDEMRVLTDVHEASDPGRGI